MLIPSPAVPRDIPRYDLVTELLVSALARRVGVEPDQFRAWTRGAEKPPEWFEAAVRELVESLVVRGELSQLTSLHKPNTLTDMPQELSSNALRSRAALTQETRSHLAVQALIRKGATIAEARIAVNTHTGKKYAYSTVVSWLKPKGDPAARGIPEVAAEAFRELYGVPMKAWSRVIPKS